MGWKRPLTELASGVATRHVRLLITLLAGRTKDLKFSLDFKLFNFKLLQPRVTSGCQSGQAAQSLQSFPGEVHTLSRELFMGAKPSAGETAAELRNERKKPGSMEILRLVGSWLIRFGATRTLKP